MDTKILQINQLIDIELDVDDEGNTAKESFSSRIEDKNSKFLFLAYPFKNGYPVPVQVGEVIRLRIVYKQNAYACNVKVISKQNSPVPLLKVTLPEKLIKIQMRNWVRINYNSPIRYRMAGSTTDFSEAISIDISGGGILFQNKHPLELNDKLEVEFTIDNKIITTTSKVVRCIPHNETFRIAIKYEEISETDRDKIVGFIFKKQREFIKKGLL